VTIIHRLHRFHRCTDVSLGSFFIFDLNPMTPRGYGFVFGAFRPCFSSPVLLLACSLALAPASLHSYNLARDRGGRRSQRSRVRGTGNRELGTVETGKPKRPKPGRKRRSTVGRASAAFWWEARPSQCGVRNGESGSGGPAPPSFAVTGRRGRIRAGSSRAWHRAARERLPYTLPREEAMKRLAAREECLASQVIEEARLLSVDEPTTH